jgi:hypothetical protein
MTHGRSPSQARPEGSDAISSTWPRNAGYEVVPISRTHGVTS